MSNFSLKHRTIPAASGESPHPALLLLHGLGDSETGLLSLASHIDPRVFIVSARGPYSHPWGGYSWFDLQGEGPRTGAKTFQSSVDALRSFLTEMTVEYSLRPDQIYIGGFSMGAAMAGAMALIEPDRIRGAIMVSGFLPLDDAGFYRSYAAKGHPFFQAHGTLDPIVSLVYARMTRDYLRGTPVHLTYREYVTAHNVSTDEIQDLSHWFSALLDAQLDHGTKT